MCRRKRFRQMIILLGLTIHCMVQPLLFADERIEKLLASVVQTNETTSTLRDPFLPVGYQTEKDKKEAEAAAAVEVVSQEEEEKEKLSELDWDGAMKLIQINGVSSKANNEFLAVINGEVRTVGEIISVQMNDKTYSWTIDKITPPGSVKLRRVTVK